MNLKERTFEEILGSPEGRTLEFKASLPKNSDLAKTVVAFANDAGGRFSSALMTVIGRSGCRRRNCLGLRNS